MATGLAASDPPPLRDLSISVGGCRKGWAVGGLVKRLTRTEEVSHVLYPPTPRPGSDTC